MTSTTTMYEVTPREATRMMEKIMRARKIPFLKGSPGTGKSALVTQLKKKFSMDMIDHRISTSDASDFSGLPDFTKDGFARFAPFLDLFPLLGADGKSLREPSTGCMGWILFLDEFNHGSKEVQTACYKLLLDAMIGQYHLDPRVFPVLAGNLITDRAFVQNVSTALMSRVIHLKLKVDSTEWLEDCAIPQNFDYRIIAYIAAFGGRLMDFDPGNNEETFCCPRTWEFMSDIIKDDKTLDPRDGALYSGTITSGVAADFVAFTNVFGNLVNYKDVIKDPMNAPMPQMVTDTITNRPSKSAYFAQMMHLLEFLDEKTFGPFALYIDRFTMDVRLLFQRMVVSKHPELRHTPEFAWAMQSLNAYLNNKD